MGVVMGELKMVIEGGEREELRLWYKEGEAPQQFRVSASAGNERRRKEEKG